MTDFADRIKAARKRHEASQVQVADAAGVSVNTVQNWERGTATPSMDSLRRICIAFQVSADFLLCLDGDELKQGFSD